MTTKTRRGSWVHDHGYEYRQVSRHWSLVLPLVFVSISSDAEIYTAGGTAEDEWIKNPRARGLRSREVCSYVPHHGHVPSIEIYRGHHGSSGQCHDSRHLTNYCI